MEILNAFQSVFTDYLLTFKFVTYLDHSSCSVEELTVLFNKPKIYANLTLIVLSTPQMNVSIDLFINDLAHRGKWNNVELRFVTFSQFIFLCRLSYTKISLFSPFVLVLSACAELLLESIMPEQRF